MDNKRTLEILILSLVTGVGLAFAVALGQLHGERMGYQTYQVRSSK